MPAFETGPSDARGATSDPVGVRKPSRRQPVAALDALATLDLASLAIASPYRL
jgi:hypothetical protein